MIEDMEGKLPRVPKLIVTDWDGTFSEQGSMPRPEVLQAKDKLIAQGSQVVLVSGRSTKEVIGYVNKYNLSPEFIVELGSVIYYRGKELINHGDLRKYEGQRLYQEFTRSLDLEKMNAHDAMFQLGIVDQLLDEARKKGMKLAIFTPKDGRPGEVRTNLMEKKGTVLMRGLINTDFANQLLNQTAPFLEVQDTGLVEDHSGDHTYHLILKGANKDSAVVLLQQLLNITKEETIGLGDSLSDLFLVLVVDRFYLMRNGLTHTPGILDRFRRVLSWNMTEIEIDKIMQRIKVTEHEAGSGWAEAINDILA